jgi:gas vesicle protein
MSDNMKQLLKLLLGAGLLLTDADKRDKAAERIRDRVDDLKDTAKDKYEDAVDRLERVTDAVRGREPWTSKAGSFLLGMGVGVGLGILFAPASGEETRSTIASRAEDIRDRVSEQAGNVKDRVREAIRRESTGTTGESGAERMPRPA